MRDALDALPPAGNKTAIITRIAQLLRHNLPDEEPSLHGALTQSPADLGVADAHQLALLVQHPDATDLAVLSITYENARAHLQLWRSVVNHAPNYAAEVPLYVAGMAAWIGGDGPVANIALQYSQDVARTMADYGPDGSPPLLHDLIGEVVTPDAWAQIRLALLTKADPRVRHEIAASGHPLAHHSDRPNADRQQLVPAPEPRPRPADPGITL